MMGVTFQRFGDGRLRIRIGVGMALIGLLLYLLGAEPSLFNLDQSPITGLIQILVFLIGLAVMCFGGYICISVLWNGAEKTIVADIGLRLVSTGYVIAIASGLADVFGFGTERLPNLPSFGVWQEVGVMVGEAVIAIGFLLAIPFRPPQPREG